MADPFIREHVEQLIKCVRGNAILLLIKPYKNISIAFISKNLNIDEEEVENLLVSHILDGSIKGRIDQVNGVLRMNDQSTVDRYVALEKWAQSLEIVGDAIIL